jgi:putative endonuclease
MMFFYIRLMLTAGWMYMLECSDGTFYTGSTNNLTLRLHQHQVGEGANYTKKRLPVKLVYSEEFERIDDAFYREKQVQGWNRKKKEALMRGDTELLKELSKSRAAFLSSDMASAGSATAEKTATGQVTSSIAATESRIPSSGESMAVAEPVEATNLLGNATAEVSAMASTGSDTAESSMACAASPLSAMASTGSATADNTATAQVTSTISATQSRIPSSGESMAVAIAVAELAEAVEATNLLGNATAENTPQPSQLSKPLHS